MSEFSDEWFFPSVPFHSSFSAECLAGRFQFFPSFIETRFMACHAVPPEIRRPAAC
jgi:hypothetical protein